MDSALEIYDVPKGEHDRFIDVLQPTLRAKSHLDLFLWMQGDLQRFLPHDIFLAVWGDDHLERLQVDLISAMPQIRTTQVLGRRIMPLIRNLLQHWRGIGHLPFCMTRPNGFSLEANVVEFSPIDIGFGSMRSALAHGIQDKREHYQCLYVAFSQNSLPPPSAAKYMRMLMPHIDFALRQVTPLPSPPAPVPVEAEPSSQGNFGLTPRESEIMKWVSAGKTNEVIGVILNISPFTVKNHLKRIFQKLEVTNRAQAVSKL